jgi:hypothetical protein
LRPEIRKVVDVAMSRVAKEKSERENLYVVVNSAGMPVPSEAVY